MLRLHRMIGAQCAINHLSHHNVGSRGSAYSATHIICILETNELNCHHINAQMILRALPFSLGRLQVQERQFGLLSGPHLEAASLIANTVLGVQGGGRRNYYSHRQTQSPQGQRDGGRARETGKRAAMQTNTADVSPPRLINGCGCLLCPPANNTAASSIYYSATTTCN